MKNQPTKSTFEHRLFCKEALMTKFTSTKDLLDFHAPTVSGKLTPLEICAGYSREFYFEFACSELSKEHYVMDFGGLKR